jgi:CBS domain-containing protein
MRKLVRDAMTANPRTIGMHQPVVDAARIMADEDVGSIPVVDDNGILAGIVTDRDIAVRVVARGRDPYATRVVEIATKQVSPAYPEEPLDDALEQMAYRRVRRLPVIENDRVVGILAQADVVHEVKGKKAGELVDEISNPTETSSLVGRLTG